MWPKQVLWPIYSFHKGVIFYWLLVDKNNNILLDKSYDLSTYIFKMYQLNNNK